MTKLLILIQPSNKVSTNNKRKNQIQLHLGFGPIVAAEPPESAPAAAAVGWMELKN